MKSMLIIALLLFFGNMVLAGVTPMPDDLPEMGSYAGKVGYVTLQNANGKVQVEVNTFAANGDMCIFNEEATVNDQNEFVSTADSCTVTVYPSGPDVVGVQVSGDCSSLCGAGIDSSSMNMQELQKVFNQ